MTTPHPLDATATMVDEESTPPASAAELAALRARLREVEAALGLPLRPGQAAPPDVPALRRRVTALERHLGVVPGLVPLPGCDGAAAPARATTITSEPAGREPTWRAWGRAVLAAVAVLAALAWLLHPLPGGPGYFPTAQATARPAAGAPDAAQAPVAVPAEAPAALALDRPATLPDTPRLQPRLAWLDAFYNGPAAGGAPPCNYECFAPWYDPRDR